MITLAKRVSSIRMSFCYKYPMSAFEYELASSFHRQLDDNFLVKLHGMMFLKFQFKSILDDHFS